MDVKAKAYRLNPGLFTSGYTEFYVEITGITDEDLAEHKGEPSSRVHRIFCEVTDILRER